MTSVLSYPPRHAYVDRLHGRTATLVHRDQPWPRLPDLYDLDWLAAHTGDWDVAHLHFTWEQYPPERLAAVLDVHRAARVPIVWTAHDLRNPHTPSAEDDEGHLRLLADRADAVLTLTPGAAAEIGRRFGREALVVPHGPLLAERPPRPERSGDARPRVLVHAKSLRANLDVDAAVAAAGRARARGADLELVVAAHDEATVRRELTSASGGGGVRVEYHAPWSSDELVVAIAGADVLLLPYRWGTHSGMVELAADVGTPVVAADVGYLAEQVPVTTVPVADDRIDVEALAAALLEVTSTGGRPDPVPWRARRQALEGFLADHGRLYRELTT